MTFWAFIEISWLFKYLTYIIQISWLFKDLRTLFNYQERPAPAPIEFNLRARKAMIYLWLQVGLYRDLDHFSPTVALDTI